jgi:uncharacterized protein YjbJ (UPF0337 family)
MNADQLKGQWHQLKGNVTAQWGKLTDQDVEQINGEFEKLVGKVQERYGVAREKAEEQVKAWQSS